MQLRISVGPALSIAVEAEALLYVMNLPDKVVGADTVSSTSEGFEDIPRLERCTAKTLPHPRFDHFPGRLGRLRIPLVV